MKDRNKIKSDFQKNGYVFIPDFITATQIKAVTDNFNRFLKEVVPRMPLKDVFYEDDGKRTILKQLSDLQLYDRFFNDVLVDRKFTDLAELLLEDKVIPKDLGYFNKPPLIGKPTPPHQDGYYFMLNPSSAITMWMPLEPVDEANGCVRYVKGSHAKGMRPHGRTKTLGFSQGITDFGTEDIKDEVFFSVKPGDLLIHHALTIHRAEGNKHATRSRKALGLIYYGSSAKEDVEAKAAYHKKLQEERA
jgi:phytanoyl-CoA hydroxylase